MSDCESSCTPVVQYVLCVLYSLALSLCIPPCNFGGNILGEIDKDTEGQRVTFT